MSVSTMGQYGLVLVRVGLPPARLLVERLVVPEADGVDAEQAGGRLADERGGR